MVEKGKNGWEKSFFLTVTNGDKLRKTVKNGEKMGNKSEKSRIRETKHLSTDADKSSKTQKLKNV